MKKLSILCIGLAGMAIWGVMLRSPELEAACNAIQGDGISCGEEIFIKESSIPPQEDKQAGAEAIANKSYPQAIVYLTRAWNAKKDPETLIMLENAKVANQSLPIRSIAVTIPASQSTPLDIPTSMLKAVAFAQQQWNADSKRIWKLQVVIVNDENNKYYASKLSDSLLKRDVIAGIGSYSSEVTSEIKNIYQRHKTVLISSTSTANDLTNNNPDSFFFRVCPNNKISGQAIATYLKDRKYTKIALFRTSGKKFSDSMTAALKANIQDISIVTESNFKPRGNAIDELKKSKQAGAQAIVLIPDAYTSQDPERDRLLSIIAANNGEVPIIGNEVAKDQTLFNRFNERQLQKLVISLPWHSSSYQNHTIVSPSFWGDRTQLDHRIAMTFDATQVAIQALDRLPIDRQNIDARSDLQKTIGSATFTIPGITGEVGFVGSDRSRSINSLVRPKCRDRRCAGFEPAN